MPALSLPSQFQQLGVGKAGLLSLKERNFPWRAGAGMAVSVDAL